MKATIKFSMAILFFLSTLACVPTKSTIGPNGWVKLGTRTVNMVGDHDEILVTAAKGVFTKVKFKVLKAPIHVLNIKIVYASGDVNNFTLNRKFAAGTESKVIDLPGNKRIIKKIVFNYKSVPVGKGKAVVVAWGKH